MARQLHLEPQHYDSVSRIIKRHLPKHVEVMAFGSRVKNTNWRYSDLDLALKSADGEKIPITIMMQLMEAFSESDLPIMVDVCDWNTMSSATKEDFFKDCLDFFTADLRS